MKTKRITFLTPFLAIIMMLASCNSSYKLSTSSRVDLKKNISYIPTLANMQVQSERVSATITIDELKGLSAEQGKQTVVAKALEKVNADVLIAPKFTTNKGDDGKMVSITVCGYPASFSSFRPLTTTDYPFVDIREPEQDHVISKQAANTMTVAELQIDSKQTITLSSIDLGKTSEAAALKKAQQKMMIQHNADLLFGVQYSIKTNSNGIVSFTLTAFPARYVNYRTTTKEEVGMLNPQNKPTVYYNTTADITPISERISLKFRTSSTRPAEVKEMAREAALQKYNADFLLNEQFFFDYEGKTITRVYISGTPAKYANFRAINQTDLLEWQNSPDEDEADQPVSLLQKILSIFKKK